MRMSRPCYDKFHRCPGWAGGGMRYAKVQRCDNGLIPYPKGRFRSLKPGRCRKCGVIVLPSAVRWLDRGWWRTMPRHWKWNAAAWLDRQQDRPSRAVRLIAGLWWHLDPIRAMDRIPGFRKAYEDRYNAWADQENAGKEGTTS